MAAALCLPLYAIDAKIDRLLSLRIAISEAIAAVPNEDERLVLQLRYVEGFSWGRIATALGMAVSTVCRWHNSGLGAVCVPSEVN